MDSFERREAKLRAQEKWAVVRKSVLPEKDEFLEKANKGKSEEWLEHWNDIHNHSGFLNWFLFLACRAESS